MAPITRSNGRGRGRRAVSAPEESNPTQDSTPEQTLPVQSPDRVQTLPVQTQGQIGAPPSHLVLISNEALQALIRAAGANQGGNDASMTREQKFIRDFRKHDPLTFEGKKIDPMAAEAWVEVIETTFGHMNCPEDTKVNCTSYMLKGEVHFWWKTAQRTLKGGEKDEEPICWHEMKRALFHKYFPLVNQYQNEAAFLNLRQGNKTVEEYDLELTRLSGFAPEQVDTEKKWIRRFIAGLREEI